MISKNRNGGTSTARRGAGGEPGKLSAQPGQGSVAGGIRIGGNHGKESLSKEQNKNKSNIAPARFASRPRISHSGPSNGKEAPMAQPLDKAHFEALMAQAGLDLTEAEKEGIRAASAHTQAAAARVRTPREVSVESATIFTLKGASA
jgi:hypothetical protein